MFETLLEAMMMQTICESLAPKRTYSGYDSLEEENRRLREEIDRQDERIERLENALIQAGTAQPTEATVFSPESTAALPPAAETSNKVDGFSRGQILDGRVNKLHRGGANVTIGDYFGFVPKGQISEAWVDDVADFLHVGQKVRVKVIKVDRDKELVILSIKQAKQREGA